MIISINDDLDLKKIAESGQCFRWKELSGGNAPSYRIIHRGKALIIRPCEASAAPCADPSCDEHTADSSDTHGTLSFELGCSVDEFDKLWRSYLDLDENYRAIRERIDPELDPFLYASSVHETGIRILRQDPWEALISFIISQNRNIPAIMNSIELLCEMAGEPGTDPEGNSFRSFPGPEAVAGLSLDELTACRLGYRNVYVSEAAKAVASGSLDLDLIASLPSSEEKAARLMEIKGIGKKVASCMLLYGLHDMDAFPIDVWVKRILEDHYPGGYPFERYSPYNGLCQQYMFAWYRANH